MIFLFSVRINKQHWFNKPSLELSAPEAGVLLLEFLLFRPDSFFFFFFGLADLSVGVTETDFLLWVGIFVRSICQPFVATRGVHGNMYFQVVNTKAFVM